MRAPHHVLRRILSYVTFAIQKSDAVARLRYRWQWLPCDRSLRATKVDNAGETDGRLAGVHYPSCPTAMRSPLVTVLPVHPAAVASANQITRHYRRCSTRPSIAAGPAP